jgi:uncharacterized protein (TIGR03086 family)
MTVDTLRRAVAAAEPVLANVKPAQLDRSTPCASWDVRALVNHLVGSTHWFAATVATGVAPTSDHGEFQSDVTGGDIQAAYRDGTQAAIAAFSAPGALDKSLKLPFGEMPANAFLMMASIDQLQHAWDLAVATGQATDLDPGLAASLLEFATAAVPDTFRGPDAVAPFGPVVPSSADAAPNERLAAFLGRRR